MRRRFLAIAGTIVFLSVLIFSQASFALFGLDKIKALLIVVDEFGQPVSQADITMCFKGGATEKDCSFGKTDSTGKYVSSAGSSDGQLGITAEKEGYYYSVAHHDFFRIKFGRWQPWPKEITVVMRPILNPVPMYVRNTFFEIPALGKEVGFDLGKSEWVIPYGQGVHADFIFKIDRRMVSDDDFDAHMVLTFSNPHDGIQLIKDDGGGIFNTGSQFRLPRTAPLEGYQPKLDKTRSTSSPGFYSHQGEDANYIFRVRSEVDEEGKLVRALYGKIRGKVGFDPRGNQTAEIYFHYYLNPDYTRNLEWDPKRNLSHPSDSERVEDP